jgi:hypothetical protein
MWKNKFQGISDFAEDSSVGVTPTEVWVSLLGEGDKEGVVGGVFQCCLCVYVTFEKKKMNKK